MCGLLGQPALPQPKYHARQYWLNEVPQYAECYYQAWVKDEIREGLRWLVWYWLNWQQWVQCGLDCGWVLRVLARIQ